MKHPRGAMDVEAELRSPNALVQLVHYHFATPPDSMLRVEGKFRIELCLTARHRSSRACFRDHWRATRFERIGPLFLVPPAHDMLVRSDEQHPIDAIVCELNAQPTLGLFDRLPQATERHLLGSLDIRDARLRDLLLRLAEEAKHPGFASEILVESMATQMSIELFRHGNAISERDLHGGLAPWQLRRVDERLREVRETPTLAELAQSCGISVRHLTRVFHQSKGISIGSYVAEIQMEHAKELLAAGQSVASVANTLRFSSSSSFCSAFRRVMGVTPGRFQTLLRN